MQTNHAKAKLREGGVVFGGIVNENAPSTVELFGAMGFDFVMLDCEHGPMDLNEIAHMVRAAEVFGITPLVRVPTHDEADILRYLDRGVQGIIVPHVNSKAEAEEVSRAARYAPDGTRGSSGGHAHDYNIGVSLVDSKRWVNDQMLVVAMIEEMEAIGNLDSILTVPGVDVCHVAAGDLGQSMGNPAPEELRRVQGDAVAKIKAAGKYAGIGGNSPANPGGVVELIRCGASFVTIPALGLLRLGADSFRAAVDEGLKQR